MAGGSVAGGSGAVINNAGQDLPLAESAAETEIGSRIQLPSGRQAAGRQQAGQQRFWRQIAVIRCQRAEPRFQTVVLLTI